MPTPKSFVFRFADVEIDESEPRIRRNGDVLPIEPKAFRVLLHLLRNPGRLIPKNELIDAGWGDTAVTENSLTRNIALLRRLLADDPREPRIIETVSTVGYRLICPVTIDQGELSTAASTDRPDGKVSDGAVEILPGPEIHGELVHDGSDHPEAPRQSVWSRRWLISVTAAVLCIVGFAALYLLRPLPPPRITAYDRITHDGKVGLIAGTDGSRIYFSDPSGSVAKMVSISGGEIANIPVELGHMSILDVSPDGSHLLARSVEPTALWTMPAVGGPAQFISKIERTLNHTWSPDGKYIAYSPCSGGLFVMRGDGSDARKLVTEKDQVDDIGWSPDGSRIRFTVNDALWEVSSTGANLHPLFRKWSGPAGQCCGRWTPDGEFFLFLAGGTAIDGAPSGSFEQIWALDERHHFLSRSAPEPVQLVSGPIHWLRPILSKDGNKIFANGMIERGELVRLDPKSRKLAPFLGGISADYLAVSRDRKQIVYVSYPEGILWRAKADGSERVQLTSPPLYPMDCRWSPDGTQIAFAALRNSSFDIYTVPAQGGEPIRIVPEAVWPRWSADGRRILYGHDDSENVFDLDTRTSTVLPGSRGLWQADWSPDGRYIAAFQGSPPVELKVFDLQTQHWSTLLAHIGALGFPIFSHDGRWIYVLNGFGPYSIYRVPVSGGRPELIAELRDLDLTGSSDGSGYSNSSWFGLDPDDNPLLLRDVGSSAIYALTLDRK
jgi:DNA-binding winged helix-turn-helix (wHTH) protein/Tol biopolymer transport system component